MRIRIMVGGICQWTENEPSTARLGGFGGYAISEAPVKPKLLAQVKPINRKPISEYRRQQVREASLRLPGEAPMMECVDCACGGEICVERSEDIPMTVALHQMSLLHRRWRWRRECLENEPRDPGWTW